MSEQASDRRSADEHAAPRMISVTPTRLVSPVVVGPTGGDCRCTTCRAAIHAGQQVGVYAYRLADAREWDIARVFCRDCAPAGVSHPTLGTTELLVTGRLGTVSLPATQSHRLCVVEVLTRTVSPQTEGTPP